MDAISQGNEIFTEVANSVDWDRTNSLEEASDLLKLLVKRTRGLVIVDFLDTGCWDSIQSVEYSKEHDALFLNWHDYRNVEESQEEKEMRTLAFPAQLYSLMLKFKELRIVKTKNFPVFMIRGYAIKDKEIKKILNNDSEDFKLLNHKDNFSKEFIKKTNGTLETYMCLNTPIFSMIILPKSANISRLGSKKALFSYNLADSIRRLEKVNDELEKESLKDEDIICEKANTVRRIFEYVLKVELCYRYQQVSVKSDYSDLLLGDLMKLVKPLNKETTNDLLTKITVGTNELSHESGKPISREKASAVSYMTILYTKLIQSEIKLNPYPEENE